MAKAGNELTFDFSTCFGRGKIPQSLWKKNTAKAARAYERLSSKVADGKLGFWNLPGRYTSPKSLAEMKGLIAEKRKKFDTLVLIGIGGSALGARMLLNGLAHRYHNEVVLQNKKGPMRLYLLENNDPESFNDLISHIDLKRTLFNVISKSGSTAETACQFILVRDALRKAFPKSWQEHLVFTTDPENGILRVLADEEKIETLPIPTDTGGRFSVLSPVGLFPAIAMGADAGKLVKGAAAMASRCLGQSLSNNPALMGALVHYLADTHLKRNMVVAMPYADRLRDWTEWFCQLWAESLGKEKNDQGEKVHTGTTPIKTLGAIDQHSQVQLYMEGPDDKVFMFIRNESYRTKLAFPPKSKTPEAFQYLSGHSMQELIQAEQQATRFALGERGRMTYQVTLPKIDAFSLGQLIFWAEAMTVFSGYLYGINPFDQPGVELGKKFAYGLMGRSGFEKYREKIEKA